MVWGFTAAEISEKISRLKAGAYTKEHELHWLAFKLYSHYSRYAYFKGSTEYGENCSFKIGTYNADTDKVILHKNCFMVSYLMDPYGSLKEKSIEAFETHMLEHYAIKEAV